MILTRETLENGVLRDLWRGSGQTQRMLTDEELDASVEQMITDLGDADPWVFGYGSLVWNPLLHFVEREPALLRGYHRRFCLWSRTGRGSPDRPGLVLGLDRGGCCRGVAFRLERSALRAELRLLWRREMISASYEPRWLPVTVQGSRPAKAVAFLINRDHPNYAGKLSLDVTVRALATGIGALGSSRDYLLRTIDGLRQYGVSDPHLLLLRSHILRFMGEPAAG